MTTYLTKRIGFSQHDSSHGGKGGSNPDDYKLIKNWYESVLRVLDRDTHAVIFHNECSEWFCKKHSTEFLSFVRWDKNHRPSYNDERFYAFREYLTINDQYKRAISTDMFDVQIFRNPFLLMDKMHGFALFCGSEKNNVPHSYGRKWVNNKMRRCKLGVLSNDDIVYNAGICGGSRKNLLSFYETMISHFNRIPNGENANMAVFNRSIRDMKTFAWDVFTGHPLHNIFESKKATPETYIKHK